MYIKTHIRTLCILTVTGKNKTKWSVKDLDYQRGQQEPRYFQIFELFTHWQIPCQNKLRIIPVTTILSKTCLQQMFKGHLNIPEKVSLWWQHTYHLMTVFECPLITGSTILDICPLVTGSTKLDICPLVTGSTITNIRYVPWTPFNTGPSTCRYDMIRKKNYPWLQGVLSSECPLKTGLTVLRQVTYQGSDRPWSLSVCICLSGVTPGYNALLCPVTGQKLTLC